MRSRRQDMSHRWATLKSMYGRKKKSFSWIIFLVLMIVPCLVVIAALHSRNHLSTLPQVDSNDNILDGLVVESRESLTKDLFITRAELGETVQRLKDLENEIMEKFSSIEKRIQGYNISSPDSIGENDPIDKECKLIFTLSSAHSGGDYLHELFSNIPQVMSYNKSPPQMLGDDLLLAKTMGLDKTYHTRAQKKIPPMEGQLRPGLIWFDSSHLFIESWYDVAMDYFYEKRHCDVKVIVLRRYWPQVLQLLLQEGFSKNERNLYHSYTSRIALLPPAPLEIERYRAHEQIIWYLLDIEKQIEHFKQRYPNVHMVYTRIESLTNPNAFSQLLKMLDIPVPQSFVDISSQIKPEKPHEFSLDWNAHNFSVSPLEFVNIAEDIEAQYLASFVEIVSQYEKQGITFGDLPSLQKIPYE